MEFRNHCGIFKAILTGGGWICSGLVTNLTRWTLCVFFPTVLETPHNWSSWELKLLKKGYQLLISLKSNIQMDLELFKLSCACLCPNRWSNWAQQLLPIRITQKWRGGGCRKFGNHLGSFADRFIFRVPFLCQSSLCFPQRYLGNLVWSIIPKWRAWSSPLPYW